MAIGHEAHVTIGTSVNFHHEDTDVLLCAVRSSMGISEGDELYLTPDGGSETGYKVEKVQIFLLGLPLSQLDTVHRYEEPVVKVLVSTLP